MKKYLKLTKGDGHFLKVELYYSLGGMNYFINREGMTLKEFVDMVDKNLFYERYIDNYMEEYHFAEFKEV